MALQDTVTSLQGTGVFELVLPFLLVFAIVYGLLKSIGIFGDDKPNVIIGLVMAILAVVYFPMGEWLQFLEGRWALWLILLLMVMITLELVGFNPRGEGSWYGRAFGLVALLGVIGVIFLGEPDAMQAIFGTDFGATALGGIPVIGGLLASLPLGAIILVGLAIVAVWWLQS